MSEHDIEVVRAALAKQALLAEIDAKAAELEKLLQQVRPSRSYPSHSMELLKQSVMWARKELAP